MFFLFFNVIMNNLQSRLEEAKQLEAEGRYEDADVLFSELIVFAQKNQDSLLPTLFNHRGIDRRMLRQYDESFIDYENALNSNPDNEQSAFAWVNKADIYRVRDLDFPSAHSSLDEALTYAENGSLMHAKTLYQRALIFLAQEHVDCNIRSHEEAVKVLEELLKIENTKDVKKSLGQNLQGAAVGYIFLGDLDKINEAYGLSIGALNLFEELNDQQGIFNSVINLGRIAEITKKYDEAIIQYKRGWNVLEKTGYGRSITTLSLHLAEAYLTKGEIEKAKPYLERFGEGIVNEEITDHDKGIIKERYQSVRELYNQSNLNVKGFDDIQF